MAEREMLKIINQMRKRWVLERVAIAHRTGVCPVGEASVIIAVSSAHRKQAIEAAHFAIDTLKATVPIWKKVKF
jgi:molybdopterin synthase catalytic subunit